MMHRFGAFGPFAGFRDLQVAVPLSDGQWLSFATALPQGGLAFSPQFLLSMGIMAVIILAVSYQAGGFDLVVYEQVRRHGQDRQPAAERVRRVDADVSEKIANSTTSPSIRAARGAGSRRHRASALQGG